MELSLWDAKQVLEAYLRKVKTPNLLESAFEHQLEFITDPARLKAALTTRRAGKSYAAGLYLFKVAVENDGVSCLYVALTRDSAKRIMWRDIIKDINRKNNFNAQFNETTLTVTLPNDSAIYLMGADAKPDEMEKFLGGKYKLIIIDEAGSFRQDVRRLVYSILKPTTTDLQGTIAMIGTPTDLINNSLFYDVTETGDPGWSVHKWSAMDNPYMCDNWKDEIETLTKANPRITETPMYQQMYLGKWYIDTSKLVYQYNPKVNTFTDLPREKLYYVIGCDLGYDDATSMVVCCYSDYEPVLYVVEVFKKTEMIISEVADKLKELQSRYNAGRIVIDNANKQAVQEMVRRYGLSLTPADKAGKSDFIEIMNSDLLLGRIRLKVDNCMPLVDEWNKLIWDDRSSKREEHPSCENHASDACLYAWRYCYQYAWRMKPYEPPRDSAEYLQKLLEEEGDRMLKKIEDEKFYG